jgi:RHH-type rel operon transcriptional repressor/antitoxin RelB
MATTTQAMSIQIPAELNKRLEELARKSGRAKGEYLIEALDIAVGDLEDYYSAAEVLKRVRSGEEKTYSLDEVRKELGLED